MSTPDARPPYLWEQVITIERTVTSVPRARVYEKFWLDLSGGEGDLDRTGEPGAGRAEF